MWPTSQWCRDCTVSLSRWIRLWRSRSRTISMYSASKRACSLRWERQLRVIDGAHQGLFVLKMLAGLFGKDFECGNESDVVDRRARGVSPSATSNGSAAWAGSAVNRAASWLMPSTRLRCSASIRSMPRVQLSCHRILDMGLVSTVRTTAK